MHLSYLIILPSAGVIVTYAVFLLFIFGQLYRLWSGLAQWLGPRTKGGGVPGSRPGRVVVRCGLEQVTFPQLRLYICSYLVEIKSSTELMLIVEDGSNFK